MDQRRHQRAILALGGRDRVKFLQGLVSNDVERTAQGLVYAALLSPQGKYLADFFILARGDRLFLDVAADFARALHDRLNMYRLRADVDIAPSDLRVRRGLGPPPEGAMEDPRHPALGWRLYGADAQTGTDAGGDGEMDWDAVRVARLVPQTGIELIPNETYILEAGFERLNGVDFKKGCYVGQEVTARMKHKSTLKKGLARVLVDGAAPVGTPVLAEGKAVGRLFTQSGGRGLAHLRFERARGELSAGEARLWLEEPEAPARAESGG